jgi:hypothetical protein
MDKRLYKIEKQAHCIRIVFKGGVVIGPDDILAALDHENELFPIEGRQSIWDFRGCQAASTFGFDAMNRIVDRIRRKYGHALPTNKTALLVDDSTSYGLSRMFQMLMDGFPTQIGVFQDEGAAWNWIDCKSRSEEIGL